MARSDIKAAILDVLEENLDQEFTSFAENPDALQSELDHVSATMSREALNEGIDRHGGVDGFVDALAIFFAFKAALVRKGFGNGSAAGAAGGVLFGLGPLGEGVARASGLAAVADIANGLKAAGEIGLVGSGAPSVSRDLASAQAKFGELPPLVRLA